MDLATRGKDLGAEMKYSDLEMQLWELCLISKKSKHNWRDGISPNSNQVNHHSLNFTLVWLKELVLLVNEVLG